MKRMLEFLSENFQFLVVKFSVYLNRRVFVMKAKWYCGYIFMERGSVCGNKQEVTNVVSLENGRQAVTLSNSFNL